MTCPGVRILIARATSLWLRSLAHRFSFPVICGIFVHDLCMRSVTLAAMKTNALSTFFAELGREVVDNFSSVSQTLELAVHEPCKYWHAHFYRLKLRDRGRIF